MKQLFVEIPIEERFWPKVEKTDGCWNWMACKNHAGYGTVKYKGQSRLAHRLCYELLIGPIPAGLVLDHLCRNPACVNPAHLDPVTHQVNMSRGSFGTRTHCHKGHPFDAENTYRDPNRNRRVCRTCVNESHKRSYWARRQAA